jgi:glycoside/pentoside/hexuronide:cation symporter, GPH family
MIMFASSSLGSEALTQSRSTWLLYYYAPPSDAHMRSLLPVGLAGVILFIDGFTGAFYNPLVGHLSDRTRSRLGRRLPYIIYATPLWALFALLTFTPPQNAGTAAIAAYMFLTVELYSVFSTLSGGPFQALLPEIAVTSAERLRLVGMRVYFGAAGGAAGLVAGSLLVDQVGYKAMALAMAMLALILRYLGMAGAWGHSSRTQAPATMSLRVSLRTTFANSQFLIFVPSVVLFQLGVQMILASLPYYVKAVLNVQKTGTWVAILTGIAIVSMLASLQISSRLARRTSKRHAYRMAMLGAACVFPAMAIAGLLPAIPEWLQIAAVMAIAGPALSGVYLFPDALTADIIDDDTNTTGMRREAMYYGAANLVQQTAGSLGPLFLSGLLILGDTHHDQLGLRLVGPAAGLLVFAGYLIFRHYDLPDDVLVDPLAEVAVT